MHAFGKLGVIVAHASPPFADKYQGLTDEQAANLVHALLRRMFPVASEVGATGQGLPRPSHAGELAREAGPVEFVVTRWEDDKYSRGSYSFLALGEYGALHAVTRRTHHAASALVRERSTFDGQFAKSRP